MVFGKHTDGERMPTIEALIERLEAGECSLELDQAISVAFGSKGGALCPPYSHRSPLLRMSTIARLRRMAIRSGDPRLN